MKLFSVLLLSGFISGAQAQPVPPPPPLAAPVAPIVVMPVPLPPQGCVWASRVFSDGAAFCTAANTQIVCKSGKWDAITTEACKAAPSLDAR